VQSMFRRHCLDHISLIDIASLQATFGNCRSFIQKEKPALIVTISRRVILPEENVIVMSFVTTQVDVENIASFF